MTARATIQSIITSLPLLPWVKVTAEIAKVHAESEFEKYRIVQDQLFKSDFDHLLKRKDKLKE